MRNYGNRTIMVNKTDLIETIKANKETHIEEYGKAVTAYKKEVHNQLDVLRKRINDGNLEIEFKLVMPIDNRKNYDKIVEMFEWEVKNEVELSQDEFKEYVQDETSSAIHAKMSNMTYINQ